MRPILVTLTGVSASAPIALDHTVSPQQVSVQAIVTGTATFSIERTSDRDSATAQWVDEVATRTASEVVTMTKLPATYVRVRITAGTGTVQATILQAGAPGC